MKNFSEEIPEIHNGNGNGHEEKTSGFEKKPARITPTELQEQIEALVEEIGRIKGNLQTVSRGPAALEYAPEVQDMLNAKEELLKSLLEKQRKILEGTQN